MTCIKKARMKFRCPFTSNAKSELKYVVFEIRKAISQKGTVKYFSQKRLCKNEVLRREVRRGGCQAPLICSVAYSGGAVKGAASAAFIGVTGYGHADP